MGVAEGGVLSCCMLTLLRLQLWQVHDEAQFTWQVMVRSVLLSMGLGEVTHTQISTARSVARREILFLHTRPGRLLRRHSGVALAYRITQSNQRDTAERAIVATVWEVVRLKDLVARSDLLMAKARRRSTATDDASPTAAGGAGAGAGAGASVVGTPVAGDSSKRGRRSSAVSKMTPSRAGSVYGGRTVATRRSSTGGGGGRKSASSVPAKETWTKAQVTAQVKAAFSTLMREQKPAYDLFEKYTALDCMVVYANREIQVLRKTLAASGFAPGSKTTQAAEVPATAQTPKQRGTPPVGTAGHQLRTREVPPPHPLDAGAEVQHDPEGTRGEDGEQFAKAGQVVAALREEEEVGEEEEVVVGEQGASAGAGASTETAAPATPRRPAPLQLSRSSPRPGLSSPASLLKQLKQSVAYSGDEAEEEEAAASKEDEEGEEGAALEIVAPLAPFAFTAATTAASTQTQWLRDDMLAEVATAALSAVRAASSNSASSGNNKPKTALSQRSAESGLAPGFLLTTSKTIGVASGAVRFRNRIKMAMTMFEGLLAAEAQSAVRRQLTMLYRLVQRTAAWAQQLHDVISRGLGGVGCLFGLLVSPKHTHAHRRWWRLAAKPHPTPRSAQLENWCCARFARRAS